MPQLITHWLETLDQNLLLDIGFTFNINDNVAQKVVKQSTLKIV